MSLQAEIIPFTIPSPSGPSTFTINHVRYPSVQAKAYIFICASSSGINSPQTWGFGLDDGTTHIATALATSDDPFNGAGLLQCRGYTTQYSVFTEQSQAFFGGAARILSGYVSAMNVGSCDVTLNLNNTPGASWFAIMIGGDDVLCKVGVYDISAGSGTAAVGFDPVAIIKLSAPDAGVTGEVTGAYHSYGFATPCGPNQVGWGVFRTFSQGTSYQLSAQIQADIIPTATTISDAITVSSYPSNGFGLTVAGTPHWNIGYLAIGGSAVSANLVSITQPTSTGVQNTAITATNPVIAFFASTNKVATAGAGNVDSNLTFGVYDGSSNMSQWWGNVSSASRVQHRRSSTANAITMATATGDGASTVNAAASCTLASTNIALNWTTVDATQREVWALVLAHNLTGTTNNCGVNANASITVIKNTTPITGGETEFPFIATGGLSPSSFVLMDGESQLFPGLSAGTYGISESVPAGWTVSYNVSDSSPHDAIVLGTGEAVTVTVTNTFQTDTGLTFRKYRRWALPYDGNKRIFIPRIEIVAKFGVGNTDAPNPVMFLRISPDGGNTWGTARQMPLGAAGDTMVRAYLTRLGQLRNPVAELYCDDDVMVAWVECVLPQDFSVGTS